MTKEPTRVYSLDVASLQECRWRLGLAHDGTDSRRSEVAHVERRAAIATLRGSNHVGHEELELLRHVEHAGRCVEPETSVQRVIR
jgi:hypothetical protein